MTLNGVMAIILHYFAEFGSFRGQLRKSGWLTINRLSPEECQSQSTQTEHDGRAVLFAVVELHTLCQLAYMIYIRNAKARINILSITAGCMEYRLFVAHNSQESVSLRDPLVGWEGVKFGQLILRKIINKMLSYRRETALQGAL